MKTTKEKADSLIKEILQLDILVSESEGYLIMRNCDAVKCAILSVKHTIEVLLEYSDDILKEITINDAIYEQTELLKELENRL